ncbi:tyrosine-type recombinase/integrase [Rhodococcus opacus]|uniref:tyrosine-type recombinase/integrase n=1 Tax=Rhodococcus opacus TaxID=37919 RepID=UPI001B304AEF|nr:site-specific integrase [Rhodococcus opacus]
MADTADRPGVAHLVLAPGVAHLNPETAVFGAMLDGWAMQQGARFLQPATIEQRRALLRRLAEFTNDYPWNWQCADLEEFIASCRRGTKPIVVSTARIYEITLRQFLTYVTDPRYGWPQQCRERFGVAPRQLLHEENSIVHVTEHEGDPRRRPLTYDEIQALFDAADARVEQIRAHHRKGAAAAMRDAALLKTVYAFGIRRREAWGLDLADLRHNPKAPQFGRFGALFVRWGKSSRGSPPKRRTVLTVPEMDWIVPVLEQWCTEVRPRFGATSHPAVWVTERADRMSLRRINEAFTAVRDAAGLEPSLDLHCLRHSYITHLVEFDYPEKFVSAQVGHSFAASTAIYTGVSDEYRNRLLQRSLAKLPDLWGQT